MPRLRQRVLMTEKGFKRYCTLCKVMRVIFTCHQKPERSFFYKGVQFPVCARCTGFILGVLIIAPIVCSLWAGNMYLSIGLVFLTLLDGGLQALKIKESTNVRRLITGMGLGYAYISIIIHIVKMLIKLI